MTNRLAGETSPYLLQHAANPVAWRPWGPEALAEAKAESRPILLSIGYAACHWCHVMAHECFEDEAIAAEMNRLFVNIKIDREERPDLDAIYQQALAMMGQHGGWPLTMFCTPDGEPFWGGTYFPPVPRYGRPSFPEVMRAVDDSWRRAPDRVKDNVEALKAGLEREGRSPGAGHLDMALLDEGARRLLGAVDTHHGGLQGAPKFPQPGIFDFLWRAYLRTGDKALRDAVTLTLEHLCHGGIYDHLGGGFMRYSTDEVWLAPHFEKMLYDNAQLIELLTLAWQETSTPLYAERVAETVGWVLREMIAEHGAFAATLDADSEGHEGRFYTWTAEQVESLLDPEAARWFAMAYDVRPGGNWEGVSILHRNHQPQPQGIEDVLATARQILWRERETRPRPGRDDKVLADWNGMMIAALAQAAFVFDRPDWLDAARTAFDAVALRMALPGGRLAHSMRLGRVSATGLLDDLAHMARAALALHQATGDGAYLEKAGIWVAAADHHHWDAAEGGYFMGADDASDLVARTKAFHDHAVPSGNGIMAQVLARLGQVTGEDAHLRRAEAVVASFSAAVRDHFANMTAMLAAFEQLAAPVEIAVGGDGAAKAALLRAVAAVALPTAVLQHAVGPAQAVVCRQSACLPPIADAETLRATLTAG
ncbi:thioredoxin domain-containing protein [Magnetospirillum sp. UT-4]|uniref:thioredoxin domain-containing protein n=1 Tax=Magnetospirillum sp. UT-4 TaxID=2681467 RepID=UPI001380A0A8|nr:thioredoxin domain-containing protein [Magnetospirillum sp. UT-4]CAA7621969.1 conserved hypothetical protein [Magnetospirillum sp. UT-4]